MTISSRAFTDIVLDDGADGDVHDLGTTFVPAGTLITIQMNSDASGGNDTSIRIDKLTVAAVPGTSSGADLVWAGADGDAWNTIDMNFTDAGSPAAFVDGDNVTVQTAGAIHIDGHAGKLDEDNNPL